MALFPSLSKVAKTVTGSVSGFRKILDFNPSLMSFALPPQVSMGLKIANTIGSVTGAFKVPTEAELKQLAQGKIDLVLKGARRDVLNSLAKAQSSILRNLGTTEEVLKKLEWLL